MPLTHHLSLNYCVEDSISRLAEMGFARDHALEALETLGSNVAMEYALTVRMHLADFHAPIDLL